MATCSPRADAGNVQWADTVAEQAGLLRGAELPWVRTAELTDGTVSKTAEGVTKKALAETSLRPLPRGTLLVAMYGQGQTRGRTGLLGVEATVNQACFAILPKPTVVEPRFLQYWFRANYLQLRRESEGRGGSLPNLNGVTLRRQMIPVQTLGPNAPSSQSWTGWPTPPCCSVLPQRSMARP